MRVIGISGLDRNVAFKKRHWPNLTPREYRIIQGFDSAAALVGDEGVESAAAEERFSREKGTGAFPAGAVRYCLDHAGLRPADVDGVAHAFAYDTFRDSFDRDDDHRLVYTELYDPAVQRQALADHFPGVDWTDRFVPVPHHVAHAASAFYPSGFSDALILVTDGMGEIHSMTAFAGTPDGMEPIRHLPAVHSLGILYGVFTLHLGFFMGLDEYKVMGLAPYGDARRYYDDVMQFVTLQDDGTYTISLLAENRTSLEKETHRGALGALERAFGPARKPEAPLTQDHKDLAASLQAVLQTCQLHLLRQLKRETKLERLCLAGGVALNCTANGTIKRSRLFKEMFVQPAAGDDGSALGAALYVHRQRTGGANRRMTVPLWGPAFTDNDIAAAVAERLDCTGTTYDSFDALVKEVARRLAAGEVVAWFQDRMEFGPRALGSRSILADPRAPDMRDRINALVKKREGFRPFAPAVAAEAAATYFDIAPGDERTYAHMLYVVPVRREYRDRLPAITHVDGSARIQTVSRDDNPRFWAVLDAFGTLTGMPIVLNTSFNVRGQPIVCTPAEAIDTYVTANLDALAIGDTLVVREDAAPADASERTAVRATSSGASRSIGDED